MAMALRSLRARDWGEMKRGRNPGASFVSQFCRATFVRLPMRQKRALSPSSSWDSPRYVVGSCGRPAICAICSTLASGPSRRKRYSVSLFRHEEAMLGLPFLCLLVCSQCEYDLRS